MDAYPDISLPTDEPPLTETEVWLYRSQECWRRAMATPRQEPAFTKWVVLAQYAEVMTQALYAEEDDAD